MCVRALPLELRQCTIQLERSVPKPSVTAQPAVYQLTGRPSSGNCDRPSDRAVAGVGAAVGAGALGVTGMKCDMPTPPAVGWLVGSVQAG